MNLPSAEQTASQSESPLRIAVADDDRSMRELLQHMLHKQGHEVVALAETGQKLIKLCASTKPDVIITDNLMPDIDGADAAAIIYAERPTPIILLSGYCDRDLVLDAEQKHVLMYLVKPISDANLRAALTRCRARLSQQAEADNPSEESHAEQLHHESPDEAPVRNPSAPPALQPFGRRSTPSIRRDSRGGREPAGGAGRPGQGSRTGVEQFFGGSVPAHFEKR